MRNDDDGKKIRYISKGSTIGSTHGPVKRDVGGSKYVF
jgi:hypothetical protein